MFDRYRSFIILSVAFSKVLRGNLQKTIIRKLHRQVLPAAAVFFAALIIAVTNFPNNLQRAADPIQTPASLWTPNNTAHIEKMVADLPVTFEPNSGQIDPRIDFIARLPQAEMLLNSSEAVLRSRSKQVDLRLSFIGARTHVEAQRLDQIAGRRNYLLGNDSAKWLTNVPLFARVRYAEIYPGVSLTYYGNHGAVALPQKSLPRSEVGTICVSSWVKGNFNKTDSVFDPPAYTDGNDSGVHETFEPKPSAFEYDLEVEPHADPRAIRLKIEGVKLRLSAAGDLVLAGDSSRIIQSRPVAYQIIAGRRRAVDVDYQLRPNREIVFDVGDYDRNEPLVIDPTIIYSTYLGGSNNDSGSSIAVDASNNVYVAGTTSSTNFPTRGAAFPLKSGLDDIFVTKIDATGKNILYSTYIGGSGLDRADGIAVDANGNAYVVGRVGDTSTDFPTTAGSLAPTYRGGDFDGVVFKLNSQGNALIYSTFLGGEDNDSTEGIAVDAAGNAYVTGGTRSSGFPVTSSAFQSFRTGDTDAYLTKLNSSGSAVLYSTLLGGGATDRGSSVALDNSGKVYLTGFTASADFPTQNAFQGFSGGSFDAFIAKFNPDASGAASLVFSTYLGGSGDDKAYGIALAGNTGNIYVAGQTSSSNFPILNAMQSSLGGFLDAFVAEISPSGEKVYATYLGGSGDDRATGIAVNSAGAVYVTGYTSSTNFPVRSPLQSTNGGGYDAFLAKFNAAGSALVYSTYLGGAANENTVSSITSTNPIALDTSGNAYVTGYTASSNFPAVSAIQPALAGGQDAFVVRISDSTGGNQIDTTDFFVHQQYLDFLDREPDASGLAFWTGNITACGTDAQCVAGRRVNVSAAFILSLEFQQTGFLVERMYKAAYGDASGISIRGGVHQLAVPIVRFNEFLPDMQEIGHGLVVGQTGWETVLENNQQSFATDFVQRARFTAALPTTMTPAQFIDKLNSNCGGVLSSADRTALINLFGSATDTAKVSARVQVLRQISENQSFVGAELNRAFVLMQYFGYLRRNPNDNPDSDYTGYDFWLAKLNQFNGDYNAAEMVKAFITSSEYRQRFGL